jgi:hypothetical protein
MNADDMSWPNRPTAEAAGCNCEWYGRGAIIRFNRGCPILDQHLIPSGDLNWIGEAPERPEAPA